jgi:hypothetical protein
LTWGIAKVNIRRTLLSIFELLGIAGPPTADGNYTWIQSWSGHSLHLNPLGNSIYLGPSVRLNGDVLSFGFAGKIGFTDTLDPGLGTPDLLFVRGGSGLLQLTDGGSGLGGFLTSLPVYSDAAALAIGGNFLFYGSGHLDGNGDPKLCRKGAFGAVTVIG